MHNPGAKKQAASPLHERIWMLRGLQLQLMSSERCACAKACQTVVANRPPSVKDDHDDADLRYTAMFLVFFVVLLKACQALESGKLDGSSSNADMMTAPVPLTSQVSRFLVNSLGEAEPPRGISRAHTLYTLAKQVQQLVL